MADHVPFLVTHGPLFWRLLVVALVLVVLAAIWGVRYVKARHAMRDALRLVRRNHGSLRGTLRGGDATTVRLIGASVGEHAVGSWRDDSLWLETPDREIEIVGPIQIAVGSHYTASRRGLAVDKKRSAAVIAQVPWASKRGAIHSAVAVHLSAGDEVEVRGVIESSAGQREAHPRQAAIAWTARGEDNEPLVLAAVSPAPARVPLGVVRTAAVIAATFLVGSFIHRTLGDAWLEECQPDLAEMLDPHAPLELSSGNACVLAASVPKTRELGLYSLHRYLETHPYRDAATVARLDEVAVEALDCEERLSSLYYEQQRYEQAVVEARRCGNSRIEYDALVKLARFEDAADVQLLPFVPGQEASPTTLIAAGRWREAARTTRDQAARREDGPFLTYRYCVADYLGHLGGDREATARLQKLVAAPDDPDADTCAPILAVFEPERRVSWLERSDSYYWTRYLLERPSYDIYDADQLLTQPEHPGLHAIGLWIEADPVTTMERLIAARWRVVKQVLDNDVDGALVRAREVVAETSAVREADPDREYLYSSRPFDTLIPAVRLYTPAILDIEMPLNPRELWVQALGRLVVRSRQPIDKLQLAYTEETNQAFRIAREGDGKAVLELLRMRGAYWYDSDVIALLPHITRDRDALVRALPYLRSNTRMRGDGHIAEDALTAFSRRELFEAAGATEEAARWDAIYRRIDRVLRDDQRRTALILYGR